MTANRPTAHLIYGPTAAGKTTYAHELAANVAGVRFAIDEWMQGLFSADMTEATGLPWIMERVRRCQSMIGSTALRVLSTGTDVVLEPGLLRATDRDRARSMFEDAGHQVSFTFVDAALEVRQQRVLHRNAHRGETGALNVTPRMFDAMESLFERPAGAEMLRSKLLLTEGGHAKA